MSRLAVFKLGREQLRQCVRPIADEQTFAEVLIATSGRQSLAIAINLRKALQACGCTSAGAVQEVGDAICRWALGAFSEEGETSGPGAFPAEVELWEPSTGPKRVSYTAAQCRSFLANSFLGNVNDTTSCFKPGSHQGGVNFPDMIANGESTVGAHKMACLLSYFKTSLTLEGTPEDEREVVWERRMAEHDLQGFYRWALAEGASKSADPDRGLCRLHGGVMEAVEDADAFVNFANPMFGYGHFIGSCTQEEIIQVCCPEFNVGMLHQGRMMEDEVVNTYNVRRFCTYTGYQDSFRYSGVWTGKPTVQTILTIDATTNRHFTQEMVLRDIRKAFLSFKGCQVVSSGRWGCGVFGGTPAHKFAQQIVAASLAGASFHFSSFGSLDRCDEVREQLSAFQPTTAQLLRAIMTYVPPSPSKAAEAFVQHLGKVLRESPQPQRAEEAAAEDRPEV